MLQDIRQNVQGTAAKVVVWVIVVSFALFGIESILLGGSSSGVAEVNGEEISPMEVQQVVNTQQRQLISMFGENIDPAMLDEQRLSNQALQSIIGRRLLVQSATEMNLAVSDTEMGRLISGMEQFQINGQFSPELYKSTLAQAGYTPASFKQTLQQDILVNQLRSGLPGSEFSTPAERELAARIVAEQRDIRYLTVPLAAVEAGVSVSDEEIAAYYNANESSFYSDESVTLSYIELRASDFTAPVDEDDLLAMYEQEKSGYQYQTENRVSHILLTQGEDESDADYAARIADVQKQLNEGGDFAALAESASDDIGSASAGGDLGYSAGDAFPEAMEEAIASLELNTVSEPVATDAGTHFIVVTERREGEAPSFAEMRPELEQRVQERESQAALLSTVETLRDLAFNAQSLAGPATELELEVRTSDPVTRNQAEGLFANPALLAAAFSEDVLEMGHNSEVFELAPDHFVALRVEEHREPELQPLESVRDEIAVTLRDQQARAAVARIAEQAVARLRAGGSVEAVAEALGFEWQVEIGAQRDSGMLNPALADAAFALRAPPEGERVADYTMTPTGDALVYEVSRVAPGKLGELPAARQAQISQLVDGEHGVLVQEEFRRELREQADITVY
ncbi:SurA N-terminal domain-containing protein [Parahaliea aestuarii]|uniref:Periplasmic chaperone PpiD n=1 Tax=Parahaliea aestuarii TaxID=1852021 RepID=A0A5C8ZTL3_9GAMM|nr:SurA N-terminal domain-containing protein [Parahaliea aestuarii]TXS91134.1 peptidylprolyl isomerase [Parahaliea aestuarii]